GALSGDAGPATAWSSDAAGTLVRVIDPVAPEPMTKSHVNSKPSGITLALSTPKIPTRRSPVFGGAVGRLATSDLLTLLFSSMAELIVQAGLPLALHATLTMEESNLLSFPAALLA